MSGYPEWYGREHELPVEVERLRARVAELEAALRIAEWDTQGLCVACRAWSPWDRPSYQRKHEKGCAIAAALSSPPPHDGEGAP